MEMKDVDMSVLKNIRFDSPLSERMKVMEKVKDTSQYKEFCIENNYFPKGEKHPRITFELLMRFINQYKN